MTPRDRYIGAPGRFGGVDAEALNVPGRDDITRLVVTGPFWQMRE